MTTAIRPKDITREFHVALALAFKALKEFASEHHVQRSRIDGIVEGSRSSRRVRLAVLSFIADQYSCSGLKVPPSVSAELAQAETTRSDGERGIAS